MNTIAFAIIIASLHLTRWRDDDAAPPVVAAIFVYIAAWIGFFYSMKAVS